MNKWKGRNGGKKEGIQWRQDSEKGKNFASVILYVICSVVGGRDLNELSSLSRKEGNGDHSVSGWVEDK